MFEIGWGSAEIDVSPKGYAMNGYGMSNHQAHETRTPLLARALVISDGSTRRVVLCCLDMAMVTHEMREEACRSLAGLMGEQFWSEGFALMCTHTHSSPGGCGHEAMYNFVTPGFVQEHLDAVVDAITAAVGTAIASVAPSELSLATGRFGERDEVAWNRSIAAYNRNPDAPTMSASQAHVALDRDMAVLSVSRDHELRAMMSLFGVHATCIGNTLRAHDGDNKGYAAQDAEREMDSRSGHDDAVAIFAQATAGDVSPHYHGPGQVRRRRAVRKGGDAIYAEQNGKLQSRRALTVADHEVQVPIDGPLDAVLAYFDFTNVEVDPIHVDGVKGARTSDPCHGASFFEGTRIDGLGIPKPAGSVARFLARRIRQRRLSRHDGLSRQDRGYYQELYASQGAKDIVLEAGRKLTLGRPLAKTMLPDFVDPAVAEMKREARSGSLEHSPMVATILPVQIIRIGSLVLLCCPGEFTTTAGRRLRESVAGMLASDGIEKVLIATYCNDYMGYVTTVEEYQEQAYEGGHTIFGQWTLGAFQTRFAEMAEQLTLNRDKRTYDTSIRPPRVPPAELALRSSLAPRGK